MIKTIAIVVVVLLVVSLAGVLLLAVSKPYTFRVQRATGVKASPRLERLVALRETGPRDEADVQRRRQGQGRRVRVGQ